MGSRAVAPGGVLIELGHEPEYFVTKIRTEPAGKGNVRLFCYNERRDGWHLLYTAVVPGAELAVMGRQCLTVGAEVHNITLWEDEGKAH